MSMSWQSESTWQGTQTPQLVSPMLTAAQLFIGYEMFASPMSSMPVRSRSISPTLNVTPTPAQSPSFEQRLVTWLYGSGRTATFAPRSEHPAAEGPHWPVLEPNGMWHSV